MKPHLLVVDGMALLFRSFFATSVFHQYFPNKEGIPTNGVQGFARHVLTAKQMMRPTHLAICWDMGMFTFRNDLFDGYKANRPAPPDELKPQFDMAKEIADLFGWKSFGIKGMEADDVIGSLVKSFKDEVDITIISGDKDLLQLLNDSTKIAFAKKGYTIYDVYTYERFVEEYGIEPPQFADVKAFMGDSSDGYAGVKGIGPKTALQLIKDYGTVEGVVENIHQLKPAQRKKIEEDLDMLQLSKKLATIHCDLTFDELLDEMLVPTYTPELLEALNERDYSITRRHLTSLYPFDI